MCSRWIVGLAVSCFLPCLGACGGSSGLRAIPDGTGVVPLTRFEPDRFVAHGGRAFRILGEHFGVPGDTVRVVFTARHGTPFRDGTSATLEADARIDSDVQIRGEIPEPRVPRNITSPVQASMDVYFPRGGHGSNLALLAVFDPTRLVLTGTLPAQLDGVSGGPAALLGAGFDPVGGAVHIHCRAQIGTPFDGAASVDLVGTVASSTRIQFDSPHVGTHDIGPHPVDLEITLVDSDGAQAANKDWDAIVLGPARAPPFGISAVLPAQFNHLDPATFIVQGTGFAPIGATATLRFTAHEGTPFRGGTRATAEVPVWIESDVRMHGLSPRLPGVQDAVAASVAVILPDGQDDTLASDVVFRQTPGNPRVVINEVDYDQPGTDTAEFVELYNAGDGGADLGEYELTFLNGNAGGATPYRTFSLSGTLEPGAFYVLSSNAATVPNTDLDVSPNTSLLQNGAPDGLALKRNTMIVDALSYEGDMALPYREGTGAGLVDVASGTQDNSLVRWLDGFDTDQNSVDFASGSPPTPGTANIGAGALPYAANINTSGTNAGHLISFHPTSGRGTSRGPISTGGGIGGLAFDPDGGLVATDRFEGASTLLHLRRDGSVIWDVGTIAENGGALLIADMAIHPASGVIYVLSDEDAGAGGLFTLNAATAVATRVGTTPLQAHEQNGGLAFAPDGTLYMTTRSASARLLTLDVVTATQLTSVALEVPDSITLAIRPHDGTLYTARQADGALLTVATDGTVTPLGVTSAGMPGAIAFD